MAKQRAQPLSLHHLWNFGIATGARAATRLPSRDVARESRGKRIVAFRDTTSLPPAGSCHTQRALGQLGIGAVLPGCKRALPGLKSEVNSL